MPFIPRPPVFIVHILFAKYCVRSGVYKLFLKGADSKKFSLCELYGLHHSYSTLHCGMKVATDAT